MTDGLGQGGESGKPQPTLTGMGCAGAKDHISSAQKCILLTRHQKTMTPTQPLGGIPGQTFLSYKNGREVLRKKNNLALELGASFLSFCL